MKEERSNVNCCPPTPQQIVRRHDDYNDNDVEIAMLALCDLVDMRDEQITKADHHIKNLDDVISWNRHMVKDLEFKLKCHIES